MLQYHHKLDDRVGDGAMCGNIGLVISESAMFEIWFFVVDVEVQTFDGVNTCF